MPSSRSNWVTLGAGCGCATLIAVLALVLLYFSLMQVKDKAIEESQESKEDALEQVEPPPLPEEQEAQLDEQSVNVSQEIEAAAEAELQAEEDPSKLNLEELLELDAEAGN